jgi:hypothetical protein
MRTTPELLEAWKDAAERAIEHGHPIDWSVGRRPKHIIRDLIADLEEAQGLIEAYRKDAERLDLLGKLCKETPLRPNAFCSEIAPDTRLKYEFPTLVSYDSVGNQISLRDAIDAAIAAAKGDSE